MTQKEWQQLQSILDLYDALSPEEQPAFLAEVVQQHPDLKDELNALLQHDTHLDTFLDRPLLSINAEQLDAAELVPRIGPYRLVRELGHGGMGVVYLASQEKPFQRQVAIKVVQHQALQHPEAIERFERERQVLASFKHPHIAHLYDGGTAPDGRPYLVMEYVEGELITEYCISQQLSVSERLTLFLQICDAVRHVHQKLRVLHRDLKPGNILVTPQGTVKLLDFGISKSLDELAAPSTADPSGIHLSAWTPFYSSPEQLLGKPLTTTSDVYSLGVLLYRLLSGQLPFEAQPPDRDAMSRLQLLQEIQPPSQVLARGERPTRDPYLAAARRQLPGDLDAVVLKALARNPEDRYASVADLAADIERFLDRFPVLARPGDLIHRGFKFMQRNTLQVAAGLLLMTVAFWVLLDQATEMRRVQRVSSSLVNLLHALQPSTVDRKVELRAALLEASQLVQDPMFADHPTDLATLTHALGQAFTSQGDFEAGGNAAPPEPRAAHPALGRPSSAAGGVPSSAGLPARKDGRCRHRGTPLETSH